MKMQETKDVWVAWTNTDCTEGRGTNIPKAVCDLESTAVRVGKKGYIQGTNCPVSKEIAVKINGQWLVPGRVMQPTNEDIVEQEKTNNKVATIEKAKALGLTDAELKLISGK